MGGGKFAVAQTYLLQHKESLSQTTAALCIFEGVKWIKNK